MFTDRVRFFLQEGLLSAEEIKSRLNFLTPDQLEVLRACCEHPKHSDKALSNDTKGGLGYLTWSSGQVRNLRREGLSTLMPFTLSDVCPYILGTAVDEPQQEPEPPPERIQPTPIVIERVDPEIEIEQLKEDEKHITPPPDRPNRVLPALLGLVLLLGFVGWAINTLGDRPPTEIVEVTRISEVTRVVDNVIVQTVAPEIIEQTRIVEVVEEVPILQTVIAVQTVVQEVPVTVEVTPIPTPEPTPIDRSVYEENFDDGEIDEAFEVSGNPTIVGGVLNPTNNGSMTLNIGDETWQNYSIEYDFGSRCAGNHRDQFLKVRVKDSQNYLVYIYTCAGGEWYAVVNGQEFEIPDTTVRADGHATVEVIGNQIRQTGTNGDVIEFVNTTSDLGPISLSISNGNLDNLVITRLD